MILHITVCWMLLTLVLMDTCFGEEEKENSTRSLSGNTTVLPRNNTVPGEEQNSTQCLPENTTVPPGNNTVPVKEGSTLRLKCIAETCPSTLNITCSGMAEPLNNSTECLCHEEHFNNTLTIFANITVIYPLKPLNSSGGVLTGDILECLCNISGINWRRHLIFHLNEHNIHGSTVRINGTLYTHENETFPDGVEYVCKNDVIRNQSTLNIVTGSEGTKSALNKRMFFVGFVGVTGSGVILCAVICVVALWVSCRTRQNIHIHTNKEDIPPESIKNQCYQEDINLPAADDHVPLQVQPAEEDTSTDETAGSKKNVEVLGQHETPEGQEMAGDGEVREVDYACINYSLLQDSCGECQKTEESGETEYAEIHIGTQEKEE